MINILFIKVLTSSIEIASRDKREISLFLELDYNIEVFCKGEKKEIDNVNERLSIRKFPISLLRDYKFVKFIKRSFTIFSWARTIRKSSPDIISGHDMIGTYIAWLSTIFIPRKRKPKIIYDSHEFALHAFQNQPSKLKLAIVYLLERFIIKRSDIVMMVNDSIAEEVQMIYKLKEKPLVIRNMPEKWTLDQKVTQDVRKELRKELNVSEDTFMVMYHGGISPARGIEKMLEAVSKVPGIAALIMGQGSKDYIQSLKAYTKTLNIEKRVLFKDAVAIEELWQFVSAADVGVSLAPNTHKNHYYMLPNKLFENIQSLTPIIGSDFPEIRKIVNTFDIGLLVNPEESDEIAKAILTMKDNQPQYQTFKTNLVKAKEELHWGLEKVKLQEKIEGFKLYKEVGN